MDVVTAFLNGDLNEDIFMAVPESFRNSSNVNKVCKLNKTLYGLKQAPRQWYAKLHEFLTTECSFKSSQNDHCLCFRHNEKGITLICLYVDDLPEVVLIGMMLSLVLLICVPCRENSPCTVLSFEERRFAARRYDCCATWLV